MTGDLSKGDLFAVRSNSLAKVAALALTVAGLESLWNLAYGRLPVYLPFPLLPLVSVPLNILVHIGVTSAVFCILGLILGLLPSKFVRERTWIPVLAAYSAFAVSTVVSRHMFLTLETISREAYTGIIVLVALAAAGLAAGFSFRLARARRSGGGGIWTGFLAASLFISLSALALNYSLHPWGFFAAFVPLLAIGHLAAWFILRRHHPSPARFFPVFFLVVIVCALLRGGWSILGPHPSRPNLVFVVLDVGRSDRLSLSGYDLETTPFLDSLAADHSLVFSQAFSPANYTYPSHVSILTGLYTRSHNLWQGTPEESARYRSLDVLPSALSRMGYRTLLLTENPWISNLYKGFQHYHYLDLGGTGVSGWQGTMEDLSGTPAPFPPFPANCPSPFAARQLLDHLHFLLEGYYKWSVDAYQMRLLREQMILRRRSQPLFYFINWMNVHTRYYPNPDRAVGQVIHPYDWSAEYDRALVHIDRRVRDIRNLLDRAGELERTVFIVTADHGELLGEYRVFGHTRSLFSGVTRVPLILFSPPWPGRRVVPEPASLVGMRPALELLAGYHPGRDLRDELTAVLTDRPVVAEHRSFQPGPDGEYLRGWMLVSGDRMKLIYDPEAPGFRSTWGETTNFLFDLERDPGEKDNLYLDQPQAVERLEELYRSWREETPAAPALKPGRLDPGLKEKLRAMGYLR